MKEVFRPERLEEPNRTEGELPESKIYDLLSSIGNAENKALTLLVMKKGVIYSRIALYQEVMNHQDQSKKWKMDNIVPFKHCEMSLSPIGLVTREAILPDGTAWGYEITDYGLTTGFDFAGALLKWSFEHPNFSLYKMFTSTNSSSIKNVQSQNKERAQGTRLKIFWEIVSNPSKRIRQVDIVNEIKKETSIVEHHLYNLHRDGLISYDATRRGEPVSCYRIKDATLDKEPEPYGKEKLLPSRIYSIIKQNNGYVTVEQAQDLLVGEYREYKEEKPLILNSRISNVLSSLETQGYIEREKFSMEFRSELTLSEEQKEVIASLVTLIDRFQKGDSQTIAEGRAFAQRVVNNPQLFSELMLKARDASPFANKTDKETMLNSILAIVQQYPDTLQYYIREKLQEDYYKKLGNAAVRKYLISLVQTGKIERTPTKYGYTYRLVDGNNQQTAD